MQPLVNEVGAESAAKGNGASTAAFSNATTAREGFWQAGHSPDCNNRRRSSPNRQMQCMSPLA